MNKPTSSLENYFAAYAENINGNRQLFETPFGKKKIVYADWTASGRAYQPIETYIQNEILPFVGNTHTETTITGTLMSGAYAQAKNIVKQHVHAGSNDVLVFCGSGMTGAVNKLQRILGMRMPERLMNYMRKGSGFREDEMLKPIVFITHMEHHSNQTSWLETIATVEIIGRAPDGNVDLEDFRALLKKYKHRKNKIAAVTACSNVTGIQIPYHEIARMIHAHRGMCFVDFACSAPYINIDMHPAQKGAHLDPIYFSPHKFLGGPGTPGVLIFHKKIYTNKIPDQPGGGTVLYSNPWNMHEYVRGIEDREDGGTPPFLQGIKAAMCIRLKEAMGVEKIWLREKEILEIVFERFFAMKNVGILEGNCKKRLGVVSFMIKDTDPHLVVKMLNDRFGIQLRGGCSCAGTYGHVLLNIGKTRSYEILNAIRAGNFSAKPGWIRLSVHPTMTNASVEFIMEAIEQTATNYQNWCKEYEYDPSAGKYAYKEMDKKENCRVNNWFTAAEWDYLPSHPNEQQVFSV